MRLQHAIGAVLLNRLQVADQVVDVLVDFEVFDGHVPGLHEGLVAAHHFLVYVDALESRLAAFGAEALLLLVDCVWGVRYSGRRWAR
jgi:hypothetical protein